MGFDTPPRQSTLQWRQGSVAAKKPESAGDKSCRQAFPKLVSDLSYVPAFLTPGGDRPQTCSAPYEALWSLEGKADVTSSIKMEQNATAEVYTVCAGTVRPWDVFQEPSSAPIASFDDKASALNYAMCLARGRVAWHLLLRPATTPQRH